MVPPSKTPKFMPSQKPTAMAAAIIIASPLCAEPAIGSGHDRADVPHNSIEISHLDAIEVFLGQNLAWHAVIGFDFLPLIAVAHRSISDGYREISSRQFGLWSNTSIAF
jgi:hypothetical protein